MRDRHQLCIQLSDLNCASVRGTAGVHGCRQEPDYVKRQVRSVTPLRKLDRIFENIFCLCHSFA